MNVKSPTAFFQVQATSVDTLVLHGTAMPALNPKNSPSKKIFVARPAANPDWEQLHLKIRKRFAKTIAYLAK